MCCKVTVYCIRIVYLYGVLDITLQNNFYICHMECLKNVFLYIFLVVMATLTRCSIPDRVLTMYNNVTFTCTLIHHSL